MAPITARRIGWVKGQPITFIHGHNRRRPINDRFWSFVDKDGPVVRPELGPCWIWRGGLLKDTGYGSFTYTTGLGATPKGISAHRYAWQEMHGPIPRDVDILHRCDVRPCVREAHLFPGTQQDNADDMVRKGRHKFGAHHHAARLSDAAAEAIREAYARGAKQRALATEHCVSQTTIHLIVHGKLWRHVGGPRMQRRMNTRLTDAQVAAIRLRHSLGVIGVTRLARMYQTSRQTIWRIVRGLQRRRTP